jgi:flagellar hook-length control protein FliK
MTISDPTKIRERSAGASRSGPAIELSLGLGNTKQSGFQSVLIQTIANSQSSSAQQSRIRNSEARYSMAAQPRISAHQTELAKSSAEKVSAPRESHQTNQAADSTGLSAAHKQGGQQASNILSEQYLAQRFDSENSLVNTQSLGIDDTQPSLRSPALAAVASLHDQTNNHAAVVETGGGEQSAPRENQLSHDATTHAPLHDSDATRGQDERIASERGTLSASEQAATKLISGALENPRDVPKSAVSVAIQSYVGTEYWGREVRQKIVWMFGMGHQSATLTLNPPNLGPLHVSVQMQNNVAHATFRSNDPGVRQALTQGLTQLNEMLSQRGLVLGRTTMTDIDKEILET